MHKIVTSIRVITADQLPLDASDQDLLNMGLVRLSGDYFSCIHQELADDDGNWSPIEGQSLPGTIISQGTLKERHDRLPAEIKAQIMTAQVIRASVDAQTMVVDGDTQDTALAPVDTVTMADIQPGDTVITADGYPHQWQGEPKR